tara:strand:- start:4764 stop:5072 length:309 start_codon:yes stop_codon:yes gene_type:complete
MVRAPNNVSLQSQVDAYKSSGATLDYAFNWSSVIASGEAISSSSWEVSSSDLTIASNSTSGTTTSAFISGGKNGYFYELKNTIQTDQSRTFVRVFVLGVKPK